VGRIHASAAQLPATQIRVVGREVVGRPSGKRTLLRRSQRDVERPYHAGGKISLHREHARQRGVVLVGPELRSIGHADQRGAHAYSTRASAFLPPDESLEEVLDAELASDLLRALAAPLVLASALPGDDAEAPDAPEPAGDLLGESICEVLVGGRAAILEREHGEHLPTARGIGPAGCRLVRPERV